MMREFNASKVQLSDIALKIFVYGKWGSGKTWFCGTAPSPLLICTKDDPGAAGLISAGKDVDVAVLESFDELIQLLNDIKFGRKYSTRKTICLDGLSNLTPLLVEKMLGAVKTTKMGRMTREAWGLAVDHLRQAIGLFFELHMQGKHIILTSQALEVKDDIRGGLYGLPITIGKYAFTIPGVFDLVLYAEQDFIWKDGVQIPVFNFYTVKYGHFPAKDRFGRLDMVERNDFMAILEKIQTRKTRIIPDYQPMFVPPIGAEVAGGD
jgi:hypothetical protein